MIKWTELTQLWPFNVTYIHQYQHSIHVLFIIDPDTIFVLSWLNPIEMTYYWPLMLIYIHQYQYSIHVLFYHSSRYDLCTIMIKSTEGQNLYDLSMLICITSINISYTYCFIPDPDTIFVPSWLNPLIDMEGIPSNVTIHSPVSTFHTRIVFHQPDTIFVPSWLNTTDWHPVYDLSMLI